MASVAFPFLRIRPDDVIADPWQVLEDDVPSDLTDYLKHWDYGTELRVKRRLRVNMARVATQLGLPVDQLQLKAILTIGTGGSDAIRHRWIAWQATVTADDSDLDIEVNVDGLRLTRNVRLRLDLLLKAPVNSSGPLTPKREGMRLWEDDHYLQLEPAEGRFPMEVASFGVEYPDCRDALWKLEWSAGDLSQEFIGAFRLVINSDVPDFVVRLSTPDPMTVRLLMNAVRLQITRGALANEVFDQELIDASPTSVAGGVGAWLKLAFPGQDLSTIRQTAATDPSGFEGRLAALDDVSEEAEA